MESPPRKEEEKVVDGVETNDDHSPVSGAVNFLPVHPGLENLNLFDGIGFHLAGVLFKDHQVGQLAGFKTTYFFRFFLALGSFEGNPVRPSLRPGFFCTTSHF